MSSRILSADEPHETGPVVWRQISAVISQPQVAGEKTQHDVEERIAALELQWKRREQSARAAGVVEGEAAGRARAAAELQPVLERLARSIEEIGHLRERLRREAEADMLKLAMAIARRVLRREMAVDPDAMHGLVLGALEKLHGQEICRVRVHPSHAAQLTGWLRPAAAGAQIDVIGDASRQPGDVIFETGRGNLDASVESQLQEIERGLTDRLRKNG